MAEEEEKMDLPGQVKDGEDDYDSADDDKSESEFSDSDEDEGDSDTGLTENQNRLLYMVSLYSHAAQTEEEKEEWIRRQALMVLCYEGIVAQVLDYDYAPASYLVQGRRKYFNTTQEGNSDIDFLREEELINGLKLSSTEYKPVTCYQVSQKGLELMRQLSKADKEAVHELVYAPGTRGAEGLLRVHWDGDEYWLQTESFSRRSTVTETEDVSYVSSAYTPQCLRHGGRPTLSNAHRAHECNTGESNIADELDEVVTLNSVSCMVAEYIPTGANQVVALNENLGSTERVQGGFFTALLDSDSAGTKFEVPPGLTSVNILDYSLTSHVNFEADIHFPEEEGIVQVETFGVSMHADGTMYYGMQIEAVMDRIKDNISLDHLSRLLVDVHQDSSKIVDSVISAYQRNLMDLIFNNDAASRDKFSLIIANEITPHLTAEEYMDKGEYENELKQVVGETRAAFDISEHDTLIFGAHGMLLAGPNSRHHEPLLCAYLQFESLDVFVRNYFNRMFIVQDVMNKTKIIIDKAHEDPQAILTIRSRMAVISRDIIQMEEILGYMTESLSIMEVPPEPPEQAGRALYERLQLAKLRGQLERRVTDLVKNMSGSRNQMDFLLGLTNVVSEQKMFSVQYNQEIVMTKVSRQLATNRRTTIALELILVLVAGGMAFAFLDRLTGDWTVMNSDWFLGLADALINTTPMIWFFVSLFFWFVAALFVNWCFKRYSLKAEGDIIFSQRVEREIDVDRLLQWVATKEDTMVESIYDYGLGNDIVKLKWRESDRRNWGGTVPVIEVTYDDRNAYMLFIRVVYPRRSANGKLAFNITELKEKIDMDLKDHKIFLDKEGGMDSAMKVQTVEFEKTEE